MAKLLLPHLQWDVVTKWIMFADLQNKVFIMVIQMGFD